MNPTADLQLLLTALYAKNTHYYTDYPGSWITDAVYQFDYVALGKLLSQLLPVTQGNVFKFADQFDGDNVFEEFVCGLLLQIFQERRILTDDMGASKIDLIALQVMFSECQENVV